MVNLKDPTVRQVIVTRGNVEVRIVRYLPGYAIVQPVSGGMPFYAPLGWLTIAFKPKRFNLTRNNTMEGN